MTKTATTTTTLGATKTMSVEVFMYAKNVVGSTVCVVFIVVGGSDGGGSGILNLHFI